MTDWRRRPSFVSMSIALHCLHFGIRGSDDNLTYMKHETLGASGFGFGHDALLVKQGHDIPCIKGGNESIVKDTTGPSTIAFPFQRVNQQSYHLWVNAFVAGLLKLQMRCTMHVVLGTQAPMLGIRCMDL